MIFKNVQMKNKQIVQSQWERCVSPLLWILPRGSVIGGSRCRNPASSQYAFVSSCMFCYYRMQECVCVFSGEDREAKSVSEGRKAEKRKGEMDEGSLGALGVLIIHCSVVGSELAISPWFYPCLMIWAVPLSLSLQLLWPNKEKREGKEGVLQQ